jgi:hypothetical protein
MVVGAPRKDAAKSTGSDAARVVAFNRTDGELVTLMFARREAQFVMTHCEIGSGATKAKSEFTYGDADFNGIRFPSAIDIRLERDGELRFHEHTDVRVISINEPLPMDIFHLAALKLPPGVWVDGSAVPEALQKPFGHIEWDGRHLKSVSNAPGDANDVRITGSPFKRRDSFGWLRLVGVMIVVVGVGLLVLVLFVRWKKMQK